MGKRAKRRQRAAMNKMNQMVQDQVTDFQGRQVEAQEALDLQRTQFEDFQFTNPFADAQNAFGGIQTQFDNIYAGTRNVYAGAQNLYEGMENRFEDMTVDMRAADFQAQQGQQQRANILQSLRGAAGTSGVAGLAQSMANQGQLQAQQISASIGQQEAMNQRLAAQGDLQRQRGAAAVDLQIRGGEAMVQQAESGRQATLLGMTQGQAAGANTAYQQQMLNLQKANAAANAMTTRAITGLAGADWSSFGGGGIDRGGLSKGYGGAGTQAGYDYFNDPTR